MRSYCWVDCPKFCKPGPVLPPHSQPPGLWILEQLEEEKSEFGPMRSPQGGKSMLCYEIASPLEGGGSFNLGNFHIGNGSACVLRHVLTWNGNSAHLNSKDYLPFIACVLRKQNELPIISAIFLLWLNFKVRNFKKFNMI